MISTKKALDALQAAGLITSWKWERTNAAWSDDDKPLWVRRPVIQGARGQFAITDETYGKRSFLYFCCDSGTVGAEIMNLLRRIGGEPDHKWNGYKNLATFQLQVSYFKGDSRTWSGA